MQRSAVVLTVAGTIALFACHATVDPAGTGASRNTDGSAGRPTSSGGDIPLSPAEPPSGRRLGATVDGDAVVFRVWAPAATAAWVEGDVAPSRAAMKLEGDIWVARVEGARAGQKYAFDFDHPGGTETRTDPYCREIDPNDSRCVVVDPSAYVWKSRAFLRPQRNLSVVYEMHVGSFAVPDGQAHGTFATTRDALGHLADLGIDVVEMMPVQAFGAGPASWGYDPQLFFAPKPPYGSSSDLRALVDEAHARGIAAWIDVVYNHTDGYSGAPLRCFDGMCPNGAAGVYFFPDAPYATTPWGPRLDYATTQVSDMILDSVSAWLTEYRGDGFRWDSVSNIRALDGEGSVPGGKDLLTRANDWTHELGGSSVAEDLKGDDAITQRTSDGGFGFDAQWDGFGYTVVNVLANASDDARDLGEIQSALQASPLGDPFARLLFVETHDTVGNGGARLPTKIDSVNPTSFAARKRSMLGGVLLLTTPGIPMLFMGQEDLATGGFTDPPTMLPATLPATGVTAQMHAFYRDMIRLRRNLDGGAAGLGDPLVDVYHRNDDAKVIAYRRSGPSGEDVLVIVNLRNKAYTRYDIGAPSAGPWKVRLDTDAKTYGDDFGGGQSGSIATVAAPLDGQPFTLPVVLGAYSAVVFTE